MGQRVLVTGGAGFIGSHVAEALLRRGDRVICFDSLDPYYDPAIKRQNIALLSEYEGFSFIQGDIRSPEQLATVRRVDAVVHLAARAGVRPSIDEAALYADVNLTGTTNVLEFARQHQVRSFVFASSSSVYGERGNPPFRESDPADRPASPYAATKRGGELLCASYHDVFDLPISCLRFFTVYGPRQRPEMAIARFTHQIAAGAAIQLYGDGSAQRDFTYVTDAVASVLAALERTDGYDVFNIGHRRMTSVLEIIHQIASALGTPPELDILPPQPGDVSLTCADIEHAHSVLGYNPAVPIEDGIARYVDWYQKAEVLAG
ncbi:MAG: NAD-dependent epimerase/dehydratase family protein [Planctomycetota bacterium]